MSEPGDKPVIPYRIDAIDDEEAEMEIVAYQADQRPKEKKSNKKSKVDADKIAQQKAIIKKMQSDLADAGLHSTGDEFVLFNRRDAFFKLPEYLSKKEHYREFTIDWLEDQLIQRGVVIPTTPITYKRNKYIKILLKFKVSKDGHVKEQPSDEMLAEIAEYLDESIKNSIKLLDIPSTDFVSQSDIKTAKKSTKVERIIKLITDIQDITAELSPGECKVLKKYNEEHLSKPESVSDTETNEDSVLDESQSIDLIEVDESPEGQSKNDFMVSGSKSNPILADDFDDQTDHGDLVVVKTIGSDLSITTTMTPRDKKIRKQRTSSDSVINEEEHPTKYRRTAGDEDELIHNTDE